LDAGRNPDDLEYVAKVRVCLNPDRVVATAKFKQVLAFYNIAEFYRDMIGQMGFAAESAHIREEYQRAGFRAAIESVPNSLVDGLPTIAATSAEEAHERLQPYIDAGVTRLIIPFIPSTDDAVGETRRFLETWNR
jgi:alkanesulfonate monooxygenase SsuD/methylene tetrahydromethanopterin reductase-like flavin-dependent oxidoreductase (luciferase family)